MRVNRTGKAVASVAASVVVTGLLLLADPARAGADSSWQGGPPVCTVNCPADVVPGSDPSGDQPRD